MKKSKIMIVALVLVVALLGVILLLINSKQNEYYVKVKAVDKNSPDVSLIVYEDNNIIDVESIYYKNDILLCMGNNLTTNKFNIKNSDELKVVLKNKREVIAKIIMEE